MTTHGTNLIVHREGDVTVVAFNRADLIDPQYLRDVEEEIHGFVEDRTAPVVVVDFVGVRYLTSRALSMLLSVHNGLHHRGGELRIANVAPEVACVFKLVKLARVVNVFDTVELALGE